MDSIQRPRWFESIETCDKSSVPMEAAKDRLRDGKEFAQKILGLSTQKVITEEMISEIYTKSKNDVKKEIEFHKDKGDNDLAQEVAIALTFSVTQQDTWTKQREKGFRKIGANIQSVSITFAGFLEAYSGIVEIVKAADQQFGGLAYGTLSLLFSLAVLKEQQEETITEALEELRFSFPRLEILGKIYPNTRIQELVVTVYSEVIEFLRHAAIYYQKSSFKKIVYVGSHPPKQVIKKIVATIRQRLAEVRHELDNLMQLRIGELCHTVEDMRGKLNDLDDRDLKREQEQRKRDLNHLRSAWQIEKSCPQMDIVSYKERLAHAFSSHRQRRNFTPQMTTDLLQMEAQYRQWENCEHSCLLVLSGRNWSGYSSTTLSWLSLAAVLVTEQLHTANRTGASYYCQVDFTISDEKRPSISQVMASIIYQLLVIRPDILRTESQRFEKATQSKDWLDEDENTALEVMNSYLMEVLDSFPPDRSVTLVLDRVDKCCFGMSELSSRVLRMQLLQLVNKAHVTLKILVVTSANSSWNITGLLRSQLKRKGGDSYVEKLDWHQESNRARALAPL